jgi:hypothetical protein
MKSSRRVANQFDSNLSPSVMALWHIYRPYLHKKLITTKQSTHNCHVTQSWVTFSLFKSPITSALVAITTTNFIWNTAEKLFPPDDTTIFATSSNLCLIIFICTMSKKNNLICYFMQSTSPPHTHLMTMHAITLTLLSAQLPLSLTSTLLFSSTPSMPSAKMAIRKRKDTFQFSPISKHHALFYRFLPLLPWYCSPK